MVLSIGPAFNYIPPSLVFKKNRVGNVEAEVSRYRETRAKVEKELEECAEKLAESAEIFMIQMEFLDDPSYGLLVEEMIKSQGFNSEWCVSRVSEELISDFKELEDDYFAQRALDIEDLSIRLLKSLLGIKDNPFDEMKFPSIVMANNLTPSDTALMDRNLVLGICTETGSSSSHTAIISRSMGIPSLVGLKEIEAENGVEVIVDALDGFLIVSPSEEVYSEYKEREDNYNREKEIVYAKAHEKAVTVDGIHCEVVANVGSLTGARMGKAHGAEGIGLLRTELMFLERKTLPDEEEQYAWYKEIAAVYEGYPVIIRTMDIGGDKELPAVEMPKEDNPFLGQRAVRLALAKPEQLLYPQLKAILRVAAEYPVKILLPMIARICEIHQINAAIDEAEKRLKSENKRFKRPEIGIMVEIPSVAIAVDAFAPLVDFFSIGTNDLTQYTLAVDRMNDNIADIADYFDPSVIFLINNVITKAHNYKKMVGMCGSMAGDPLAAALLLGMGLDEFSMPASRIPWIKDRLRRYSQKELKGLVCQCLTAPDAATVREFCKHFMSL